MRLIGDRMEPIIIYAEHDIIRFTKEVSVREVELFGYPETKLFCEIRRSGMASVTFHQCMEIHPQEIQIVWKENHPWKK